MPTCFSVLTSADVTDVLPVPAYPLRRKMDRGDAFLEQKRERAAMSFVCCPVGSNGKLPITCVANSSTVMEKNYKLRFRQKKLFKSPLNAVFGILDIEAEFSELVTDKVTCSPVFSGFCFCANFKEQVNSFFERLESVRTFT